MLRNTILISMFIFLFFSGCNKQIVNATIDVTENPIMYQDDILVIPDFEEIPPLGIYYRMDDMVAPNGKILRVYNDGIMETLWGPIYSPIIYLYDKGKKVLAKYNTIDLISNDFWPGVISITYNNERNSFDMVFSLDAYGNYGTGYIDLNTNEYVRELAVIEPSEEEILARERHDLSTEGYEEGSTLRKISTYIFSLSETEGQAN